MRGRGNGSSGNVRRTGIDGFRRSRDGLLSTIGPLCGREVMQEKLMFSFKPIGFVRSQYQDTKDVPKGLGAQHDAEGMLEVLPEFEDGLKDIEGFSHLFVVWVFDRSHTCELV